MTFKAEHVIRFVAVAQHLSFTKAAVALGVDQPWLSQQIRQLESQLGSQLFVRDTRGLQLTPVGKQLLNEATKLADAARDVEQVVQRLRRSHTECLRFGVPAYSYSLKERLELVEQHERRYPRTHFEFHGGNSPELLLRLRAHELDTAIVQAPFDTDSLDKLFLRRSYASLLMPKESDLVGAETLTVERLSGHRVAVLPRRLAPPMWDSTYERFVKLGVELVEVAEGHRHALYFHAHRERMCVLTWQWPDDAIVPGDDMVHRVFSGWRPSRDSFLIKETNALNPAVDRLWDVALGLFSGNQPPADD